MNELVSFILLFVASSLSSASTYEIMNHKYIEIKTFIFIIFVFLLQIAMVLSVAVFGSLNLWIWIFATIMPVAAVIILYCSSNKKNRV